MLLHLSTHLIFTTEHIRYHYLYYFFKILINGKTWARIQVIYFSSPVSFQNEESEREYQVHRFRTDIHPSWIKVIYPWNSLVPSL